MSHNLLPSLVRFVIVVELHFKNKINSARCKKNQPQNRVPLGGAPDGSFQKLPQTANLVLSHQSCSSIGSDSQSWN
ncbi:hypothetical protein AB205_0144820 [Aquarana catesbeiana]|uniref:Uncharacterized protein n=1 Tax=Aquarana catesbeiana TaxID=8400 RepID=A0A2G9SGN5_AQUCT|nr:hypothetical protein AB205_0144820 [Aquarana catesbeiana]